ncbi:MAG: hypothetical protein Q8L92_00645, partial [Rubrivivax sp.]|nr:hypothetical protein [Rubrivivax sp.]
AQALTDDAGAAAAPIALIAPIAVPAPPPLPLEPEPAAPSAAAETAPAMRPLQVDNPATAADGGRMVRLTTDTLNTLLAQARETLLVDEAREAEARLLQRLSRRWRQSISATDRAIAHLSQPELSGTARQAAADELQLLRDSLRETQALLTDFAHSHDRHSRRGRLAARQL